MLERLYAVNRGMALCVIVEDKIPPSHIAEMYYCYYHL